MDSSPQEREMPAELLEYAKAIALAEAKKHCAQRDNYDDVVQQALMHLVIKPPKFDPARGSNEKTLIYTIVQRAVLKAAAREVRYARRFSQFAETAKGSEPAEHRIMDEKEDARIKTKKTLDEILEYIDNDQTRMMLRVLIECNINFSEAARCLGLSEGTIRYRLTLVRAKLRAAGFDFFPTEDDM